MSKTKINDIHYKNSLGQNSNNNENKKGNEFEDLESKITQIKNISSYSKDEEEDKKDVGRTDIQCWEIDETGLDWKLLYTKEKVNNYPIFNMVQLSDGRIAMCSNLIRFYQ